MEKFFSEIKKLIPNEYEEFLRLYNTCQPYKGLRVNTLKCTEEKLRSLLDFPLEKTPFCKTGYYYPSTVTGLGKSPLHHAGAFYIQEPSATSAVTMLGVKPGDKVLDMCAAPGGKSTQIASDLQGEGILFANEIVRSRANILLSNIERMGVKNCVVTSCHPQVIGDHLQSFFDKILVDAPCSGEGMFRKDSDAQGEWSYEHTITCAVRQLEILNSAKDCLKEGGEMVYSTCTYNERENEGVIEKFLRENPEFEIVDSKAEFGRNTLGYAKRIFLNDGGEGHFCCKLRKKTSTGGYTPPFEYGTIKNREEILDFYQSIFVDKPFGDNIQVVGDKIYLFPNDMPSIAGLNVLRSGILLGEMKKNRIEPCHSAFMGGKQGEIKNCVDFDLHSEEIKKFLHGETVALDSNIKGYTAVSVNGITTGFGKASNGVLKNKYPKGLRNL